MPPLPARKPSKITRPKSIINPNHNEISKVRPIGQD